MEADMIADIENGSERKKRLYKIASDQFKKEQLAGDMQSALAIINKTERVKVNFRDPEDVRQRISDYFIACANTGRFPSVQGLASFGFGISRQALNQWRNRGSNNDTESARLISVACDMIADTVSNQAMHNNANPVMSIFLLKNNHAFADRVEVQQVNHDDDYFEDDEGYHQRMERYMRMIREGEV